MSDTFAKLRAEYAGTPLREGDVSADPIEQFDRWFDAAVGASIELANAMTLATVSPEGQPSARVVLLKGYDHAGFVFFTNYGSRKAGELEGNPQASLCFWWKELARQIRIQGRVAKVDAAESDAYFATRPRESNLGAMASAQSRVIADRAALESAVEATRADWDGRELVRPEGWGGYRLAPHEIEFWQGHPDRLHDRLRYRRDGGDWVIERLSP